MYFGHPAQIYQHGMNNTQNHSQAATGYFLQVFRYPTTSHLDEIPLESAQRYRNAVVCHLLRLRTRVSKDDRTTYWDIIDDMLNLSLPSAIQLLQTIYEYRVRKLPIRESQQCYPHIHNELYRLEYNDEHGGTRDVCAGALLNEAVDLLQEEAVRLIQAH
jgi:hypothetical protein